MTTFNPYLEAFTRSISFSPLVSVDKFVCDYILEEQPLNVKDMKANLESYKRAEMQAHDTKRRIESLKEVMASADSYSNFQRVLKQQDYLKNLVDLQLEEVELKHNVDLEKSLTIAITSLKQEVQANSERKIVLESARRDEESSLSRNEKHLLYSRLKERLEDIERRISETRSKVDRCNFLRRQCSNLIDSQEPDLARSPELDHECLDQRRSELVRDLDRLNDDRKNVEIKLREATSELADLERGIRRFPESSVALRDELCSKNIEAWILADLAEVISADWCNAIEGWLNTLRFSVIVSPDSFQAALQVYNGMPRTVAGVALPNIAKMRDVQVRPGSLAELVSSESPWARAYLEYVLGDVMTADLTTLKNYSKSVTKDCMSYSQHTAQRIKEGIYSSLWLGRSARETRRKFLESEVVRLGREIADCESSISDTQERLEVTKKALRLIVEAMGLYPTVAELASLESGADELRGELKGFDTSTFRDSARKIEELGRRIRELDATLLAKAAETARQEKELEITRSNRLKIEVRVITFQDALNQFLQENADIATECERYSAERLKSSSAQEISENYPSTRKGFETKRDKSLQEFRRLVQKYCHDNNVIIAAEVEEIPTIAALLQRLKSSELPKYIDRIAKARRDAEVEFKDHFIARLNELIEGARESFREINETLKSLTFGNNQYRFSLEERPDRKGQIEIVRKTSEISAFEGSLFDQLVDPAERQAAERLFDQILHSSLDSAELRAICDYRTYFSYDIRMRDLQSVDPSTGKAVELSLSKVLREKSGGEAQTPYYVAIAASFYRFFKVKPDSTIRLVLFDEAFDKLDDERTGTILQFYRQMGLQTLIAVPPGKLESIAPHVDHVNLVIRHGYTATVRDYHKLEIAL